MANRAAIYLRQSMDNAEGIARQRDRCRSLASARGWTVVAEFEDNAVSASKNRDAAAWGDLLAGADAREFDVVIATKVDRIARRVADVIELVDRGLGIATVEADLDTTTDVGRFQAVLLTALAELEANRKGQRHRDAHVARAAQGIPRVTKRPYGWKADGIHLEPAEADHLREALRSIVAGGSIRGEVKRMNNAGAHTVSYASGSGGKEWTTKSLVSVLDRPRMAGLNTYLGTLTGESRIEAVVSREEWEEYRAVRADPSRLTRTPGRTPLVHWLSGIAECPCGNRLAASTASSRGTRYAYYRCRDSGPAGHVGIAAGTLEKTVAEHVHIALLRKRGASPDTGRVGTLRRERANLAEQIEHAADALARATTPVSRVALQRSLTSLEGDYERTEADLEAALVAVAAEDWSAVAGLYFDAADPGEGAHSAFDAFKTRWADTPVERKRDLTARLLRVEVLPVGTARTLPRVTDHGVVEVEVAAQGEDRILITPR